MSFDVRDIRSGMDVYSFDNVYLGTVRRVIRGPVPRREVVPQEFQASQLPGELLGPMPTATIGNPGPSTQSARRRFASQPDGSEPIGHGKLVFGHLPVPIGWREVSLDDVLAVSLERVVLRRTAAELGLHGRRSQAHERAPQ
uniref:Uncharacterized protein n=1 Tax=Thermorudis sp. TaxID=1969470 RepID=A0A7C2WAB0_9BACT